mgnify:CR=1 FL=1
MKKLEKRQKEQKAAINFTYTDGEPTQKQEGEEGSEDDSDDDGKYIL